MLIGAHAPFLNTIDRTWAWVSMGVGGTILLLNAIHGGPFFYKHIRFTYEADSAMVKRAPNIIQGHCNTFPKIQTKGLDENGSSLHWTSEDLWDEKWSTGEPIEIYFYTENLTNMLTLVHPDYTESFENNLNRTKITHF